MTGSRTINSFPMLPVFLQWWRERLSECLPHFLQTQQNETVFNVSADGSLALPLGELQVKRPAKRIRIWSRAPRIVLDLPAGSILKRRITLPDAARSNPVNAVHYDLDRLTPFQPESIVWSLDNTPQPAPTGFIAFDLLIASKKTFEAALEKLSQAGLSATHLRSSLRAGGGHFTLPLTAPQALRKPQRKFLYLLIAALALAPFAFQEIQLFRVNNALSSLDSGRAHAEALQHSILLTQLGPLAVLQEEKHNGIPLVTLQNLTDALPDDTYLTTLRLKGRQLSLEGQSKEAARLIVTLRQTGNFSDVSFSGPVVRSDNHQADLFSLSATATETPRQSASQAAP
ncbi:hypothetical protein D5366_08965 [Neokomagataea tanensis]|uniref:General secretion pathway protein GspL n=1 Tax=Neokomagataea tanensis TaxID=661191 RepID=A0A4Y6VA36_9PROT|nr:MULTISPECIES: PilN domain-containing protein [Neokomagataea]QDH25317.1 hypothetical protein D5366_08965 [Neokomagataea tanensis]